MATGLINYNIKVLAIAKRQRLGWKPPERHHLPDYRLHRHDCWLPSEPPWHAQLLLRHHVWIR